MFESLKGVKTLSTEVIARYNHYGPLKRKTGVGSRVIISLIFVSSTDYTGVFGNGTIYHRNL